MIRRLFKSLFILLLIVGCGSDDYDYSQITVAPDSVYDALKDEMFTGNTLGKTLFMVKSQHHSNVYYIGGMVFGSGIEMGVAVTWAKTKSPSENGLWFSMNDFSKHLPRNESVSGYDCCRIAVRKYTESYYKNNH